MSEISELEQRITAALVRIGKGGEALAAQLATAREAAQAAPAVDETLLLEAREALETERQANAQLEERVKAIHEKLQTQVAGLESEVAALRERAGTAETELSGLREVNAKLRENNAALRAANAEGLGDAALIDAGMKAELEALSLLRAGDRAELDDILGMIAPLTEEA